MNMCQSSPTPPAGPPPAGREIIIPRQDDHGGSVGAATEQKKSTSQDVTVAKDKGPWYVEFSGLTEEARRKFRVPLIEGTKKVGPFYSEDDAERSRKAYEQRGLTAKVVQ